MNAAFFNLHDILCSQIANPTCLMGRERKHLLQSITSHGFTADYIDVSYKILFSDSGKQEFSLQESKRHFSVFPVQAQWAHDQRPEALLTHEERVDILRQFVQKVDARMLSPQIIHTHFNTGSLVVILEARIPLEALTNEEVAFVHACILIRQIGTECFKAFNEQMLTKSHGKELKLYVRQVHSKLLKDYDCFLYHFSIQDFTRVNEFPEKIDTKSFYLLALSALQNMITKFEQCYGNELKEDTKVSYGSLKTIAQKHDDKIKRIRAALLRLDFPEGIYKAIVFHYIKLNSKSPADKVKYCEIRFLEYCIDVMYAWIQDRNKKVCIKDIVILLIQVNLNSIPVLNALINSLENCPRFKGAKHEKLAFCLEILKWCDQYHVNAFYAFDNKAPSLKDQLNVWISKEIEQMHQTLPDGLDSQYLKKSSNAKMQLNLSVEAMGLFFKVFKAAGIKNQSEIPYTFLYQWVSDHFNSKSSPDLEVSPKSLANAKSKANPVSFKQVSDFLDSMKRQLKQLEVE